MAEAEVAVAATKESPLHIERRGAAVWMYLNRPEALNGLSPDLIARLEQGLDEAEQDPHVRAVVIAATGRVFCAGADLKFVLATLEGTGSDQVSFVETVGRTFDRLESFPKPVVAAVQGLAIAGGLELLLCVDLVIAGESARIGDGHATYGLIPGAGGSTRLPRRVGVSMAKYLMFTAETLTARELANTDLVTAVVPDAELVVAVDALVEKLANKSPIGLQTMKELANLTEELTSSQVRAVEVERIRSHFQTEDVAEGLRAFNEKRPPHFTGH
jgi:enoyl-CoA hydratase